MESFENLFWRLYNFSWRTTFIVGLIALTVGLVITSYHGFSRLAANWKETTANQVEVSEIQDRIREGEPEFFFKIIYEFNASDTSYRITDELGFRKEEQAKAAVLHRKKEHSVPVWFSNSNPQKSTLAKEETLWKNHLIGAGSLILILIFSHWLYRKMWPTSHPFQRRAEPNNC